MEGVMAADGGAEALAEFGGDEVELLEADVEGFGADAEAVLEAQKQAVGPGVGLDAGLGDGGADGGGLSVYFCDCAERGCDGWRGKSGVFRV